MKYASKPNESLLNKLSEKRDKSGEVEEMMDARRHRYRLTARRLLILLPNNS